jgi:hypothetical protein
MSFFKRLKEFFSFDKEYYKNGFWGSGADYPIFVFGGEPICTIVIHPEKKEETVDTDQKKQDS